MENKFALIVFLAYFLSSCTIPAKNKHTLNKTPSQRTIAFMNPGNKTAWFLSVKPERKSIRTISVNMSDREYLAKLECEVEAFRSEALYENGIRNYDNPNERTMFLKKCLAKAKSKKSCHHTFTIGNLWALSTCGDSERGYATTNEGCHINSLSGDGHYHCHP